MARPRRDRLRPTGRMTAACCAVLVFALTILAASPELHHWLHGERIPSVRESSHAPLPAPAHLPAADDDDDGCAVTLFAQGLVLPITFLALVLAAAILRQPAFREPEREALGAPRFTLLPSQAPPPAVA